MESELPVPIDDSRSVMSERPYYNQQIPQDDPSDQQYEPQPRYYIQPPPLQQKQKKFDIFSELDKIHWIIIISAILLAFFMGKSISTPIIIRAS